MGEKLVISLRTAKNYRWWWPALSGFCVVMASIITFSAFYVVQRSVSGLGILLVQGEMTQVVSSLDATIDSWTVEEGDWVEAGQILARLRSHQQPLELTGVFSPKSGLMAEIIAYPGTQVSAGDSLGLITPRGDARRHLEIIGFVSSLEGKKIAVGMGARVWPSITNPYHDGALLATVKQVGKLPMAKAAVQSIIKIPELAKYIRNRIEAEPFLVVLALQPDEHSVSGYRWSGAGPAFELDSGVIAEFEIIYEEPSLLELSWPMLGRMHRSRQR